MPSDVVVRLPRRVCHPRLDLEPEGETGKRLSPRHWPGIGDREDRGPHRAASVHCGARWVVDVVEVENVRRERVEEGGERRRKPDGGADHRRVATASTTRDGVANAAGGIVSRAGHRHPDVVDERAPRPVADRFGYLLAVVLCDESRQERCLPASGH